MGAIYCVTDENYILERNTGSAWESYSPTMGTGDVAGPPSSEDHNVPQFSGTGGKTLEDSGYTVAEIIAAAVAASTGWQARDTATITTGVLADDASEDGTVTLGKSALLLHLTADRECWVRLYTTAAARTADAARLITDDPTAGTPHGVLLDLYVDDSAWPIAGGGALSPPLIVSSGDDPAVADIYYTVVNKSGGAAAVQVDLVFVAVEA